MAETWWEAQLWNPTQLKALDVQSTTDKAVVLTNGTRRQKNTQGHIIARTRSGLKRLLIAHYDREARKYEGWAQKRGNKSRLLRPYQMSRTGLVLNNERLLPFIPRPRQ